jgi:hypothetical protein
MFSPSIREFLITLKKASRVTETSDLSTPVFWEISAITSAFVTAFVCFSFEPSEMYPKRLTNSELAL